MQNGTVQGHPWLAAILAVLGLNGLFALMAVGATIIPRSIMTARIAQAFAAGDLVDQDYLPWDARRGFHQYNDCVILQMITNATTAGRALEPRLFVHDREYTNICHTLREIVVEGSDSGPLLEDRYSRYWHGYMPVVTALLYALDLGAIRLVLRTAIYGSAVLVLLAGLHHRFMLPFAAPVAVAALFFWGLPYFGQGLSHALGDLVVMLGMVCLIAGSSAFWRNDRLIISCAVYGALIIYFDMLTGSIPTAAGLLLPATYLISRKSRGPVPSLIAATAAEAALILGCVITVIARVIVTLMFPSPNGLDQLAENLTLYAQPIGRLYFLEPLAHLVRRGAVLTYGSENAWAVVASSALIAWLVALYLAWSRTNTAPRRVDLAAFAIGTAAVPAWSLLLPTHTFMHADFMARILIVPVALGWGALLWQLWPSDSTATTGGRIESASISGARDAAEPAWPHAM